MDGPFRECFAKIEGFKAINFVKQPMPEDDHKLVAHYNSICKLAFYIDYPITAVNMDEGDIVNGNIYKNEITGERIVALIINDYAYVARHKTAVELFLEILNDEEAKVPLH